MQAGKVIISIHVQDKIFKKTKENIARKTAAYIQVSEPINTAITT